MKNNKEIQEKFTKAEEEFLKARSKLRNLSGKNIRYMKAFEDYNEAKQQLQDVKDKIKGTVLFQETVYSIRCGECGHTNGIYCDNPSSKTLECSCCGKILQIEYEIVKIPSY